MADPYASHLPVLKNLADSLRPKRILEFGSGTYSTPFFLALDHLESLVSIESNERWRRKIRRKYGSDERLDLKSTHLGIDPMDFDLVFIDNGTEPGERVQAIRKVLWADHPPVVIHDADVEQYSEVIWASRQAFWGFPTSPATAVVW